MDRATALRKIRACLRLAGSSNANEAAAALRQAKAMMEQYGVHPDEADPDGICEGIGATRQRGGRLHDRTWLLAETVARLFGCYVYSLQKWSVSTTLHFIGVRPAPELAEYAFAVLNRQLERAVSRHLARVRKARNRRIRAEAFGHAWVDGLQSKLGVPLPKLPAADQERFEAFAQRLTGNPIETEEVKVPSARSRDRFAGYQAGRNATLNQGVTGNAARLLEAR